jgi:predicted molibdopterin-dependent oxidoreductase YjgC
MNESLAAISAQLIAEHSNVEQVTLIHDTNNTATDSNVTATTTELATTKRSSDDGMISRARPQLQNHHNKNNKKTKKNKVHQIKSCPVLCYKYTRKILCPKCSGNNQRRMKICIPMYNIFSNYVLCVLLVLM